MPVEQKVGKVEGWYRGVQYAVCSAKLQIRSLRTNFLSATRVKENSSAQSTFFVVWPPPALFWQLLPQAVARRDLSIRNA